MIWNSGSFSIFKDQVVQDNYFARAVSEKEIISNYPKKLDSSGGENQSILSWKLSKDISKLPQYKSEFPLIEALYNLSLEEMQENIEPDQTFRTGAEWVGVWTRDISYSIILSLAIVHPDICKTSLRKKVLNKRIVQDTGTGGAYPVSTDRVVWGIAAWELFLVTGDKDWLEEAYEILKNSMEDDLYNAFNEVTGLYKGESSFLDWREQTYPKWMQPVDIYESESLGTNAAHYQALEVLSQMAKECNELSSAAKYKDLASKLKKSIFKWLWMEEKGYFGQFLYGRKYKILSPRAEALGEALCVLYDIADDVKQKLIVRSTPINNFGIPSIYPQIPHIPSYHNNSVWPFVQSFWTLAAAKVKNSSAVMESLSGLYRAAALFLTNKENFEANTGDDAGTETNSDRQLWSIAGNLGMIYKIIFGIEYKIDKLIFNPFVPKALDGTHRLTNFIYRKATLNIEIKGFGTEISKMYLNGKLIEHHEILAELEGKHEVKIIMNEIESEGSEVNKVKDNASPDVPEVFYSKGKLTWNTEDGEKFKILKNGQLFHETDKHELEVPEDEYAEYQVIAIDKEGVESFASEPLAVALDKVQHIFEIEHQVPASSHPFEGYSGSGFIETTKILNASLTIKIDIEKTGKYAIDFRYSNGHGPINTDNKCAIRTLRKGDAYLGTIVMPQRGINEWSNWGFSNSLLVHLDEGSHNLTLSFEPENENMNSEINEAMLDYMRVTMIK